MRHRGISRGRLQARAVRLARQPLLHRHHQRRRDHAADQRQGHRSRQHAGVLQRRSQEDPAAGELPPSIALSTFTWQSYQVATPDTSFREQIIEISTILNKADLGLGYRVLHEIELYLANSKNLLDPAVAFDLQVKQRILPRVRGPQFIGAAIDDLLTFMKRNRLPRSEQRLNEMKNRLKRDGYTSFWR